jgi:hypothetical protein
MVPTEIATIMARKIRRRCPVFRFWRIPSFNANDPVHRAAANDIDLKTRATRGSVCNGLLFGFFFGTASIVSNDRSILPEVFDLPPVPQRFWTQEFKELVRPGFGMQVYVLKTLKDSDRRGLANVFVTIDVQSFDRFKCRVKLLSVSGFEQ